MAAKKKTKNSKLKQLFNLSTTKGKLLVFLLAFGLLGGSYTAYKTFAATSTTAYSGYSLQGEYADNTKGVYETQGDKRSLLVWDLYSKGSTETRGGIVQTMTGVHTGYKDTVFAREYFRVCAYVRGVSGVQKFSLSATSGYRQYNVETKYFTAYTSTDYYKHCTGWKYGLDMTVASWGLGGKVDRARNTDPGSIRVSSIVIEYK